MARVDRQRLKPVLSTSSLGAAVLLVTALFVMLNYLGFKYHQRFDWTSGALYSLSDKSRGVLDGLERDIKVVVLMDPSAPLFAPVRELLERYDAASPRLEVEVVDAQRNPAQAQRLVERYQVTSLSSVVFDAGDERRVVEGADLADYDYSAMQFDQEPQVKAFKGEQLFTGAILELIENRKPKILFVTGHGEAGLDDPSPGGLSQAQDLLGRDNFTLESWSPLGKAAVPEDTDLLVVAGPRARFLDQELELFDRFLAGGGRLLVLAEPVLAAAGLETNGVEEWLRGYGVSLGADIVVDPANPLPLFSAESFFATDYLPHPVTDALEQAAYPVLFSLARSVSRSDGAGENVAELVRTSAEGWGETDLVNLEKVEKGRDDNTGPVTLGVAVVVAPPAVADSAAADSAAGDEDEPSPTAREGRMVVLGDVDIATNARLSSLGNPTFVLNTVNWLAERPNLLAIAPKEASAVRLNLTSGELRSIRWLALAVLPGLSLAAGVLVFLQRRR